ncbi:MAG: Mur ligase family protein, partial [Candidatus Mariimomonas ferrooxydans]
MQGRKLKIFFSGIAGSGISAIAGFMAEKGHIIVGSDRRFDLDSGHPLKKIFQSGGITIVPQDGSGIDSTFDLAVFSTAVEPECPDALKAGTLGTPIKTRPGYLAEIAETFKTIAVSGTSGKSTSSGMLAFIMNRLGLSPNLIGGGRVKQFKSSSNSGNFLTGDSDYLIIEACESDGSIVKYKAQHSIILNLSLDHHPVDKTAMMFKTLMENTVEKVITNADDKNLIEIMPENIITFSIHNPSKYRASEIIYKPFSTDFSLNGTNFSLALPGKYNIYNTLSCIALLSEI